MVRRSIAGADGRRPLCFARWEVMVACGLAVWLSAIAAGPALASRRNAAPPNAGTNAAVPSGPLLAIVSLAGQHVSFYGAAGLIERSPVSTGQTGYSTPTGVFAILQKNVYHRSNIYDGAPMPYMQRITWSGIAFHAGEVPGYPASHGCIRMPHSAARRVYGMTRIGQRVLIASPELKPAAVEHGKLPVPVMQPVQAVSEARAGGGNRQIAAKGEMIPVADRHRVEQAALQVEEPASPYLNPVEYAKALQGEAAAQAVEAESALNAAHAVLRIKQTGQRAAAKALQAAEIAIEELEREAARAGQAQAKALVEAKIGEARKSLDALAQAKAAKDRELAEAEKDASAAQSLATAAAARFREAVRRQEPVSVFISRRTRRLYVRQAFEPVFDAPVTIKDAEWPTGTHVFIALDTIPDGARLKWSAVTLPDHDDGWALSSAVGGRVYPERNEGLGAARNFRNYPPRFCRPVNPDEPVKRRAIETLDGAAARLASRAPDTPATALDRIGIPDDAARRIAELTWTGASVLISDRPMSPETGAGTDFVVLTREAEAE